MMDPHIYHSYTTTVVRLPDYDDVAIAVLQKMGINLLESYDILRFELNKLSPSSILDILQEV
jgi:hypothetical protein